MRISFTEGQYILAGRDIASDRGFQDVCSTEGRILRYGSDGNVLIDKELFERYREYKLVKTVERVYEHSRFYRHMLDEAGVRPGDIRSFRDLARIPFTFPDDLKGNSYDFLCMSERHVERPVTFYSSGTTGIRKRMFFSFADIERIKAFIGYAMNSIADTEDTRILSLMTNSQGRGASQVYADSVRLRGMQAVIGCMEDGSKEILRLSEEEDCNVWFGDIGTIYRVARELDGCIDLKAMGLKLLYVTMGNVSAPVRDYLTDAFGCELITHYGLTEVGWGFAIEQPGKDGYYSNELDTFTEVIDPVTGEILPDGEEGELTFTIIGREAMPLLRYRSGDIAAIRRASDGDELDTIGFIKRRLEGGVVSPSGILVTPPDIDRILFTFPEITDYRLYAQFSNSGGALHDSPESITVEIEVKGSPDGIEKKVAAMLERLAGLNELDGVNVITLPMGGLRQYCYEKKRFIRTEE